MLQVLLVTVALAMVVIAPGIVVATEIVAVTPEQSDVSKRDVKMKTMRGADSVIEGTIRSSDVRGVELVLTNGKTLTVPLTVKGVLHTDLKPPRPVKAWVRNEEGKNVVDTMFVLAIHPGGGG